MQQDEHEEESAEEDAQEEPAEEPAEEFTEAVSTELKDPASMTPYGCPPGLPKMLGQASSGSGADGPECPRWSQLFCPGSRAFSKTRDPRSSPCTTMHLGIIW